MRRFLTLTQYFEVTTPPKADRAVPRSKCNQDFSAFWTSITASVDRNIRVGHHAMATKDGLDPDHRSPFFLCDDEPEQGVGNGRAVISLRFLIASILVAMAAAI